MLNPTLHYCMCKQCGNEFPCIQVKRLGDPYDREAAYVEICSVTNKSGKVISNQAKWFRLPEQELKSKLLKIIAKSENPRSEQETDRFSDMDFTDLESGE